MEIMVQPPAWKKWLGFVWCSGIGLIYLCYFNGLLFPILFVQLLTNTFSTLSIGPYFYEFWQARMGDILVVLCLLINALGLGVMLAKSWIDPTDQSHSFLFLSFGLWIIAVLVLLIGAVSVHGVPWVFVTSIVWLFQPPRKFLGNFFNRQDSKDIDSGRVEIWWQRILWGILIGMALLNLFNSMTPPLEYDELEYHLGALRDYQRIGKVDFLEHNFYSNLPQFTEMLYFLLFLVRGGVAAKILHWIFGVLSAAALASFAQKLWNKKVALISACLFYSMPYITDLSQTARIDLATTFFSILAWALFLIWNKKKDDFIILYLSGFSVGLSMATKWTAVAVVYIPIMILLIFSARSWKLFFRFSMMILIPVSPWIIKNYIFTGNPIYPIFSQFFHSPYWSIAQTSLFAEKHYAFLNGQSWKDFFELIWSYSIEEPSSIPILLMTTPLIILFRKDKIEKSAVAILIIGYIAWFTLTYRPWRFLLPILPLAACLGAMGVSYLKDIKNYIMITLILFCGISYSSINVLQDIEDYRKDVPQYNILKYLFGQFSEEDFIEKVGNHTFAPILWMNKNLPNSAVVLYIGEARAYYARHSVLWSTIFDQHPLEKDQKLSFTHVYVNYAEWNRLKQNYNRWNSDLWTQFVINLEKKAKVVFKDGPGVVYEI